MKNQMLFALAALAAMAVLIAGCTCPEDETTLTPSAGATAAPPRPAPRPAPKPAECPPVGSKTTSMILPSGDKACGVVKLERTAPETVTAGSEFDYTIKLTNLMKKPLNGVVLKERLVTNLELTGTSPKATISDSTLQWDVGTMKAGETKAFLVRASAKGVGPAVGCADVTYDNPEVCLTIKAVQPALQVVKTGPAEVIQCDPITYNITVSNPGTGPACNVVVTDTLPDGVTTLDGKKSFVARVGTLAPGEAREFSIQAKAAKKGTFTNSATANADGGLTAKSSPLMTKVTLPELDVTKTGPKMRYVGRAAEYTITVKNKGDAPAKDTILTDVLPANATLVSASDKGTVSAGKVVWQLGTLAAGASKNVTVTLKMTEQGVVRNVASASAYCAKGSGLTTTTVKGIPAILLECIDLADPIEVGAQETYEIAVTNQGSATGTNIVVTCTLPDEQEFVSATGPTKETAKAKEVAFAPLATLAPKAKVTYRVVVKGTKAGDVRFKVTLKSDQMDTPSGETESTHIYSD